MTVDALRRYRLACHVCNCSRGARSSLWDMSATIEDLEDPGLTEAYREARVAVSRLVTDAAAYGKEISP